jgi:hypothetical protein
MSIPPQLISDAWGSFRIEAGHWRISSGQSLLMETNDPVITYFLSSSTVGFRPWPVFIPATRYKQLVVAVVRSYIASHLNTTIWRSDQTSSIEVRSSPVSFDFIFQ